MAYKVILKEEVRMDVAETVFHYDGEPTPSLSEQFLAEMDEAIERIAQHPERYSYYQNTGLRFCRLKTMRFALLYEIEGDDVIIYSVHHTSRRPFRKP